MGSVNTGLTLLLLGGACSPASFIKSAKFKYAVFIRWISGLLYNC
jgi:hypothetical protein